MNDRPRQDTPETSPANSAAKSPAKSQAKSAAPIDNSRSGMPSGALAMLILRVLRSGPLHGYAIAQKIHLLSREVLEVEEGSLYPALQKILLKGWASADWGISETNRKVRFYRLTLQGQRQLDTELADYERVTEAIRSVLTTA